MVKELLGCVDVWCDSRSEESSQSFVLWAGSLLQNRRAPAWTSLFGSHAMVALNQVPEQGRGIPSVALLKLHLSGLLLAMSPVVGAGSI